MSRRCGAPPVRLRNMGQRLSLHQARPPRRQKTKQCNIALSIHASCWCERAERREEPGPTCPPPHRPEGRLRQPAAETTIVLRVQPLTPIKA